MTDIEIVPVPDTLHLGKVMGAPVSAAVRAGGLIFTGGYVSFDPETGQPLHGPIEEQTVRTLRNIELVLAAAGSGLDKVVKVNVFLADLAEWDRMNAAYATVFGDHHPARRTVRTDLVGGFKVEIEAVAVG